MYCSGNFWENLIQTFLPSLENFQFYFKYTTYPYSKIYVADMFESFNTPFYINEKNWHVQCDYFKNDQTFNLYTLPYAFSSLILPSSTLDENFLTFSNIIHDQWNENLYRNVRKLQVQLYPRQNEKVQEKTVLDMIRHGQFNSIEELNLVSESSSSHRISARQMIIFGAHLDILFEKMTHLHSLQIHLNHLEWLTSNWKNQSLCCYLSEKIHSLKLYNGENSSDSINHIIRIFSRKCQHLSIETPLSAEMIILFLKNMKQLRSLHVCNEVNDENLINIQWLEQHQIGFDKSNCSIVHQQSNYYFWLENIKMISSNQELI
ncbi:hypothetical protein I4U23_012186 [Adineta vaga]|nr:hypothetical protein I4U23_012186 [Adineta vaga]